MKIYIASSWKNQHAVQMLTELLRARGHEVVSFVENNFGEWKSYKGPPTSFDEWVASEKGEQAFRYDTDGATKSDLVIYIGPSGTDAWAEVGAAWGAGIPVYGLWAKGETAGLMRLMATWFGSYHDILDAVSDFTEFGDDGS
jgi:hypothetical protein